MNFSLNKVYITNHNKFNLSVNFKINKGDFISIYGPSGSGKTTLLRLIAGLNKVDKGRIEVQNKTWLDTNKKISIPIQKRKIGFVFQDYALFPNMTVIGNLKYAAPKNSPNSVILEVLKEVELFDFKDYSIDKLSGGQKQRVALARAIIQRPEVLLLDEPFSSIDDGLRNKLQKYLLNIHNKYKLTTILVTHNMAEVYKLSDKVLLLENGEITKFNTPEKVFSATVNQNSISIVGTILKIDHNKLTLSIKIGQSVIEKKRRLSTLNKHFIGEQIILNIDQSNLNFESTH